MKLEGVTLSFYALIADRYSRLFQFASDIEVGLSVVVLPDNRLQITVDRVVIDKLTELYNELFRSSDLQSALRLLVNLATSALLGQGIDFEVDVNDSLPAGLRGRLAVSVNEVARDGPNQDYLTVSFTFTDPSVRPARFVATTRASLSPDDPPMETDITGERFATGRVAVDVGGLGRHGDDRDLEYQLSLDRGPWTSFLPGPRVPIDDPRLLVIGDHEVRVRARVRGAPQSLDPAPVRLTFVVDPVPPELTLVPGRDEVRLDAEDERTPRERIRFSWRVDPGHWSPFVHARTIPLRGLPPGRVLKVRARDEAGNVSPVSTLRLYSHGQAPSSSDTGCNQGGCAAGAGGGLGTAVFALAVALLMRRRLARLLAVLALAALAAACGDSVGRTCTRDEDCPAGFRCLEQLCQPQGRCDDPRNPVPCCPGQICSAAGTCIDTIDRCNPDGTCERPGKTCSASGDGGAGDGGTVEGICSYRPCATDADCRQGASCFNGFCRLPRPCGTGCASGEVCVTPTDECYPAPEACQGMTCNADQALVFDDVASQVGAVCDLSSATCSCADLPQIPLGDFGRDSRIAVLAGGLPVVSAYDQTYGDLVLVRFTAAGARERLEYVDGVPASGTPVGRTSGIRGGLTEPGPHVGRYTSVAVGASGQPAIAYYDVDNGDLKFTEHDGSRWVAHTVDAQGDAGRYAHMAMGPGGLPHIAYLKLEGSATGEKRGLKLARAKVQHPRGAGDWEVMEVDVADPPPPPAQPCGGACTGSQVCIRGSGDGGADTCVVPDNPPACSPACAASDACVGGTCRPRVPEPPPPLDDLPRARGLFPSIAFSPSGLAHVAYYDRTGGNLKGARATTATPASAADFEIVVIDGEAGTFVDGDVGLWPSLGFMPDGKMAIAYEDATNDDLVFYLGAGFTGGSRETIDSGQSGAPLSLVGADAALAVAPGGRVFVAYQDATFNDLKLARRTGANQWSSEVVLREGAWGFFADLAISGGKIYMSSLKLAFDENALPNNELRVVIQDLP
jgi:hypothetical protein